MIITPTRRRRSAALALMASLAVGAVAVITAAPSSADPPSHHIASSSNASDPFVFRCGTNSQNYCMVTSQDMNTGSIGKYPMEETLGFISGDGLKWNVPVTVIHEDSIPGVGRDANHLWAPAVRFIDNPYSQSVDHYYLYTPDLTNADDHLSSRIFVSYANAFPAQFRPIGQIEGAPAGLYMSDPEVFSDSSNPTQDMSKDYLIWADGDGGTCGGISMRKMTSETSIVPFTRPSDVDVEFRGWPTSWGTCTPRGGTKVNRPYVEGASLYKLDRFNYSARNAVPGPYTMMLSVKPSEVPAECKVDGQPNTANEVIAYATATNVTGPYTYQGIVMCGSEDEWTNQGGIQEVKTADGLWRLVYVHHDGPEGPNNRKLHSECLFTNNGKFALTSRSPEGATNINGARQWCLSGDADEVIALRSVKTGKYVKSNKGNLTASASTPGLWEQYALSFSGGKTFLNARHEKLFVQANQHKGGILVARGKSKGSWEQLELTYLRGGEVRINDSRGKFVRIDGNGRLVADATRENADYFYIDTLAR